MEPTDAAPTPPALDVPAATPAGGERPIAVERSVDLDLDLVAALDAVHRPDVLSTWLGRWTESPDGTTVVTDDGVAREVVRLERHEHGVSWAWAPANGGASSEVTIAVVPLDDGRSRVTVREVQATASGAARASASAGGAAPGIALDGLGWAVCLLALEIASVARSHAPAVAG